MSMVSEEAAHKQMQAAAWSQSALQYSRNAHDGPGFMNPLLQAYVNKVSTDVSEGTSILDVASGSGEPGLSLAKLLPKSKITMTDLADGMIAQAQERARAQNVHNASFAVADAENLSAYADNSFDVITCNCGLMLMPHPDRALKEFHRVLKRDGLCMLAVWGPPEKTELIGLMYDMQEAVAPHDSYFADPRVLGNREKLEAVVREAGFRSLDFSEINVPIPLPASKVKEMVTTNAVVAELLGWLAARGEENVHEKAEKAFLDAATARGLLTQDDVIESGTNVAYFVTAKA